MFVHEHLPTVNKNPLYMLMLLFQIIQANDVSYYFSLHENLAIEDIQFISALDSEDVILCAQACARELKCFIANYKLEQKKCELSDQRMENISQTAVISFKGCYVIEKVKNIFVYP